MREVRVSKHPDGTVVVLVGDIVSTFVPELVEDLESLHNVNAAKEIVSLIPGITEKERNLAVYLVNSELNSSIYRYKTRQIIGRAYQKVKEKMKIAESLADSKRQESVVKVHTVIYFEDIDEKVFDDCSNSII